MQINRLPIILLTFFALQACESFMEPSPDNIYDDERILRDAAFAEGLLLNAYNGLPASYTFSETATDDAVSNDEGSDLTRMATGEWSSQFNPVGNWNNSYQQIFYLNLFLDRAPDVEWSWESETRNELFRTRFIGEARALRAWYNFELLKAHGGISANGEALGFVIITPEISANLDNEDYLELPRSSYAECVQFILDDIDAAISMLPARYENSDDLAYTQVFGSQNRNRVNGLVARALKSRVLLHVASQDFYTASAKWETAANAAADLLVEIGGPAGISATGVEWYKNDSDPDIIWRRDFVNINTWELENFPPTLFGNGRTNPSQNLVDAFPMANGYPITSAMSGYDPEDPYAGRDPRLSRYIVFNGNTLGAKVIATHVGSPLDGINNSIAATRTGYYLKKLLRENVNLDPNINSVQPHFYTFFRYTEIFLNYAEAANEAWGPSVDPGHGFSAVDVISAIRGRAGIAQPDDYLQSVSASADEMRQLIRNERRLELSFEGFRFWDLRRWSQDLNEPAEGMLIDGEQHTVIPVESRAFQGHMVHGPIPYEETLRDQNLIQNAGW